LDILVYNYVGPEHSSEPLVFKPVLLGEDVKRVSGLQYLKRM